jgi:hypothetical protein
VRRRREGSCGESCRLAQLRDGRKEGRKEGSKEVRATRDKVRITLTRLLALAQTSLPDNLFRSGPRSSSAWPIPSTASTRNYGPVTVATSPSRRASRSRDDPGPLRDTASGSESNESKEPRGINVRLRGHPRVHYHPVLRDFPRFFERDSSGIIIFILQGGLAGYLVIFLSPRISSKLRVGNTVFTI